VYVAESDPDSDGPRWSAHEELPRAGGADLGEIVYGEDPDELIGWGRSRATEVWVKFWSGGLWWAGSVPSPAKEGDEGYEGVWPPPPGWTPAADPEPLMTTGHAVACECGWQFSSDDSREVERAVTTHAASHR
jgi:hypothetical protein